MPLRRRGPGLVRTVGRTAVIAGTASAVAGGVAHHQEQKYAGQAQQDAPPPAAAPPAAEPAGGGGDLASQLQELAGLHQSGVLSDEEFEAAKAKLLGG